MILPILYRDARVNPHKMKVVFSRLKKLKTGFFKTWQSFYTVYAVNK